MANKKQRQSIRKIILSVFLLLFPIIYYYFSPYLIIVGASQGIVVGSFIVFGAMFFTSLFLGRIFCGWICPAGYQQELLDKFRKKRFNAGKKDRIKYFIWLPWLTVIIIMFIGSGGVKGVDFFYQTFHGISVHNVESVILFIIIAGIIGLTALFLGNRGFCHTTCWMAPFMITGRKLGNITGLPALYLTVEKEKCIDCKMCSKICPMSLNVHEMVKSGSMEKDECILCGNCVSVCPKEVIKITFGRKK